MEYLLKTVSRLGSGPERWRVVCHPVRMIRFDLPEFLQQFVEFQIADDRCIQDVIPIIVKVDLLFEFFVTGFCGHALIIAWKLSCEVCPPEILYQAGDEKSSVTLLL